MPRATGCCCSTPPVALIAERGADAVSMDDIAAAAGVGKGTVFRRFGSRAGLMMVLLDEDEKASQEAFLFGPPPLGPDAPPLERLLAFGRERLCFADTHQALLSAANRDPETRFSAPAMLQHTHVRLLLEAAGTTGDLDAQADALLALLDADYVHHQLTDRGETLEIPRRQVGELGAQALRQVSQDWILHVDLDQFQAAVEVRRNPELAGLPVIVGGNGDPTEPRKVVTCASYPARAFGVHAGMPLRTAARKCPDAIFLPLDTDAYDAASEEVMGLLRDFGHPVEVWGWDEAYVGAELDDSDDPIKLAQQIREVVAAGTGLSCSVGISENKQRAKVATGFGKPAGIYQLTESNWMTVMGDREVDALWGVGPKTAKKLAGLGITTVADLAATDATLLDVDVRADHRPVDPTAGQGRRRHQRQRGTVGGPLAKPRRHLPRGSDGPCRNRRGRAWISPGRHLPRSSTRGAQSPGLRSRCAPRRSSPGRRSASSRRQATTATSSRRRRCSCSTSSNSTVPSDCSACGWNWRRPPGGY